MFDTWYITGYYCYGKYNSITVCKAHPLLTYNDNTAKRDIIVIRYLTGYCWHLIYNRILLLPDIYRDIIVTRYLTGYCWYLIYNRIVLSWYIQRDIIFTKYIKGYCWNQTCNGILLFWNIQQDILLRDIIVARYIMWYCCYQIYCIV